MDPIIAKLNQQVTEKVGKGFVPVMPEESSPFQQKLDNTMADRMMNTMRETYGEGAPSDITALSADGIHVNTSNPELKGEAFSSKDQFSDMFKRLNRDLNSLDATIEVLNTPGLKLSARQMLSMQVAASEITMAAEGFSRFADVMTKGVQTVLNTQV